MISYVFSILFGFLVISKDFLEFKTKNYTIPLVFVSLCGFWAIFRWFYSQGHDFGQYFVGFIAVLGSESTWT